MHTTSDLEIMLWLLIATGGVTFLLAHFFGKLSPTRAQESALNHSVAAPLKGDDTSPKVTMSVCPSMTRTCVGCPHFGMHVMTPECSNNDKCRQRHRTTCKPVNRRSR